MSLIPHKKVEVFERDQGTITKITCWMTEGENDEAVGTYDNCFLIEQDGKRFLIDTLREFYWELLREELDKTGVDMVVLTHGHFDHCQNTRAIADRYGAKVAMSGRDLVLVQEPMSQPLMADTDAGRALLDIANAGFAAESIRPFNVNAIYYDGMSLEEYGLDAYVFETPGHTKGHVGIDLWGTDTFVGDILMNPGEPVRAMLFFDPAGINESIRRILSLDADRTVHFGHGDEVWLSELRKMDL